jgi:hypothetical protein
VSRFAAERCSCVVDEGLGDRTSGLVLCLVDSQLRARACQRTAEEARDGPDDQESCKEPSRKREKSKPCQRSQATTPTARNHNEEKRRGTRDDRSLARKRGWVCSQRQVGMGHLVPGAGAARQRRLGLRGVVVVVRGGRGRVGQELRPPDGRAVLEGGIHKLRRDRVGRRRRWRLDAKVKLFWLALVVLDRELRHGPLCDSPRGPWAKVQTGGLGLGQLVTGGRSGV